MFELDICLLIFLSSVRSPWHIFFESLGSCKEYPRLSGLKTQISFYSSRYCAKFPRFRHQCNQVPVRSSAHPLPNGHLAVPSWGLSSVTFSREQSVHIALLIRVLTYCMRTTLMIWSNLLSKGLISKYTQVTASQVCNKLDTNSI